MLTGPFVPYLVYSALIVLLTAGCLVWLGRRPDADRLRASSLAVIVVAAILAAVLGDESFDKLGLFSVALFGAWTFFLLAAAWLCRRTQPAPALLRALLALALIAVAVEAFAIEPYWLDVTHRQIRSEKVARPLRIAVLADIQTDVVGDFERGALRRALDEQPDVILFAGDYLQTWTYEEWLALRDEMNSFLREIGLDAPLGVYAVGGNVDSWNWTSIFDGLPVKVFPRTETAIRDGIAVTGLSIDDSFQRGPLHIEPDPARFHIVLGHAPDYALGDVHADLLVAGHTHGGQVRVPLFGPLITFSQVPRSWATGLTELPQGGTLAVSRGIGMERRGAPRLRFFCRPELMVIDVEPGAR